MSQLVVEGGALPKDGSHRSTAGSKRKEKDKKKKGDEQPVEQVLISVSILN